MLFQQTLLLLLILPHLITISLRAEFVISEKKMDLGSFKYNGSTFWINFTEPEIYVHVIDVQGNNKTYNTNIEGCIDEFCGVWQQFGLGIVVALIILPVIALSLYAKLRKDDDDQLLGKALRSLPGMPKEFHYEDLEKATGGFDEDNLLGQGMYAKVYRGMLPGGGAGEKMAIKKFKNDVGRGDFLAELTIINQLRHKNLVSLLGWCYKNKKLLLVYSYISNGSLDRHLYPQASDTTLTWNQRCDILVGLASALHYIHNGYEQKVVHRDIKPSNILLDSDFNAYLSDFGLARAIEVDQTSIIEIDNRVPGTRGYIAPECFTTFKTTGKSDIYSFGVVVLEVICGRHPSNFIENEDNWLVDWVRTMHRKKTMLEVVDRRLGTNYDIDEANKLLLLGRACCHPNARDRPKTQTIVQIISRSWSPPQPSMPPPLTNQAFVTQPPSEIGPADTDRDLYPYADWTTTTESQQKMGDEASSSLLTSSVATSSIQTTGAQHLGHIVFRGVAPPSYGGSGASSSRAFESRVRRVDDRVVEENIEAEDHG